MAIQGFSHVGVCCSDLERSTSFYREVLGFTELFTTEMGAEVGATMEVDGDIAFESRMLRRDDVRVELLHWIEPTAEGDRERRPMTRFGLTHLCFRVEDVDEHQAAAEAWGGAVHAATRSELESPFGGPPVRLLYLTDPDGVRIELMEGTPDLG